MTLNLSRADANTGAERFNRFLYDAGVYIIKSSIGQKTKKKAHCSRAGHCCWLGVPKVEYLLLIENDSEQSPFDRVLKRRDSYDFHENSTFERR